jgi:hypothetical protein
MRRDFSDNGEKMDTLILILTARMARKEQKKGRKGQGKTVGAGTTPWD